MSASYIGLRINILPKSVIINQDITNDPCSGGKFHKHGDKDADISSRDVNEMSVAAGSHANIYSCGRSDHASGTEGEV